LNIKWSKLNKIFIFVTCITNFKHLFVFMVILKIKIESVISNILLHLNIWTCCFIKRIIRFFFSVNVYTYKLIFLYVDIFLNKLKYFHMLYKKVLRFKSKKTTIIKNIIIIIKFTW